MTSRGVINKEIEVRITPHGTSMRYYQIHWRVKKKFNLFNFWKQIVTVWNGAELSYDQPLLYSHFNDAVAYAKKIKENPALITEHYKEQDKIYKKAKEDRDKYHNTRNKSLTVK